MFRKFLDPLKDLHRILYPQTGLFTIFLYPQTGHLHIIFYSERGPLTKSFVFK